MNGFSVASAAGRLGKHGWLRAALCWAGLVAYGTVLGAYVYREGVPLTRDRLLMWILVGLLAVSLTNVRGWIRGVVVEWLPFVELRCRAHHTARSQASA